MLLTHVPEYIDISPKIPSTDSLQKRTHHQHSLPSHQRGGAPPPSSGPHAAVARLPSAGLPGAARYMPPKRAASDLYSRFRMLDRSEMNKCTYSYNNTFQFRFDQYLNDTTDHEDIKFAPGLTTSGSGTAAAAGSTSR